MSNKGIGIITDEVDKLKSQFNHVEEIVENIVSENEKYVAWLEDMDSKYVTKQIDEIDAVARETKQLESNMNGLINNLVAIKINIAEEDVFSKIK